MVAPGAGGVDELRAPVAGPRVHVDHDARWCARGEHGVGRLREWRDEGHPVGPHLHLAGVPLDHVDTGIARLGCVVVAGRHVDPHRSLVRVPEWVVAQGLGVDGQLVEAAGDGSGERTHDPQATRRGMLARRLRPVPHLDGEHVMRVGRAHAIQQVLGGRSYPTSPQRPDRGQVTPDSLDPPPAFRAAQQCCVHRSPSGWGDWISCR